jgi:hypothetical protein
MRVTLVEAQGDEQGAFVTLAPIEPKMRRRAMGAARRLLEKMGADPAESGIEGDLLLDVSEEVSRELMRLGIVSIEGIFDDVRRAGAAGADARPETRLRTASDPDRPTGTIDDLLADDGSSTSWTPNMSFPTPSGVRKKTDHPARRMALRRGRRRAAILQLTCQAATQGRCEACPYKEHALQTDEAEGVWQA